MGVSFRMALLVAGFQGSHCAQAPQVSFVLAQCSGQERLDEVPGHDRSHGPAAHAHHVPVIVLDPLPGRDVVVHERSADARDLGGADRGADTTPAERRTALDLSRRHGPRPWNDAVRRVVARVQAMRPDIDGLMSRGAEADEQRFLHTLATVIRGHTDAHGRCSTVCCGGCCCWAPVREPAA